MKYMVMECHPSYAVVLDEQGQFLKVANFGYEVGQRVERVEMMREPRTPLYMGIHWGRLSAVAACICFLLVLATWQLLIVPVGTVTVQINPEVRLTSNRMDFVVKMEALNEDGEELIDDFKFWGRTTKDVTKALTERATKQGYLQNGGEVHLRVESENEKWKTATEEQLLLEIRIGEERDIRIIINQETTETTYIEETPTAKPEITPSPKPVVTEAPTATPNVQPTKAPVVYQPEDDDYDDDDDDWDDDRDDDHDDDDWDDDHEDDHDDDDDDDHDDDHDDDD